MKSTFRLMPYINRAKTKTDGTTAVMLRITIDGRKTVMATGICCAPDKWDAKNGMILSPSKDANMLKALLCRAEQTYQMLVNEKGVVSAELLKNHLNGSTHTIRTLLETGEEERERLRSRNAKGTYDASRSYQSNLREYVRSLGREDIPLVEVTEQFGEDYKMYLKRTKSLMPGTINHNLSWLNKLLYTAVDKEIIRTNPLEDVAYEKEQCELEIRYLTREQMKRLMSTPYDSPRKELVRRVLIFTAFTGLAYVDVCGLHPEHIGVNADGERYIRKKRQKSGVESFIPLHPVAGQILDLYNITDNSRPVFPITYSHSMITKEIHAIGRDLGLTGLLGHHQLRHTYGTMLSSEGICMESIAKMMGHSNIRNTQKYAQITTRRISQEMEKLIQRRKEKGLTTAETIK